MERLTRRQFLRRLGLLAVGAAAAGPLLSACGPTPTPKVVEKVVEKAVKETVVVEKKVTVEVPAAKKAITLRYMTYLGTGEGDRQRYFAKVYSERNPGITVNCEDVDENEAKRKVKVYLAGGTLPDVVTGSTETTPWVVAKGGFLALDALVKARDPGISDFYDNFLANATYDGKLMGLPASCHPGQHTHILYNVDMVKKYGVSEPTPAWDLTKELVEAGLKIAKPSEQRFGFSMGSSLHQSSQMTRSFASSVWSPDYKKWQFGPEFPQVHQWAQWYRDLRVKHHIVPQKAEATEGSDQMWLTERLAMQIGGIGMMGGIGDVDKKVAGKFKWNAGLAPHGPTGILGATSFSSFGHVSAKTAYPEEAYGLAMLQSSTEAGMYATLAWGKYPMGRKSCWNDPRTWGVPILGPVYKQTAEWMAKLTKENIFPRPWNFSWAECEDMWGTVWPPIYYGDKDLETEAANVRKKMQEVLDAPPE